jgi:cation/acetate symporter
MADTDRQGARYERRLGRILATYVVGLCAVLLLMAWAEQEGISRQWLGPVPAVLHRDGLRRHRHLGPHHRSGGVLRRRPPHPAVLQRHGRRRRLDERRLVHQPGGRPVPAGLYRHEGQPGGLAYVLGWTGGFCLVGLLVAPFLRSMRLYTLPDYFQVRYGGAWPRRLAAVGAMACSFTYVIAQIYGIGLIASRLTGVQFEIGILLGLGGVLLCSFLGGMRAFTWTQVAQYVVLLLAFLIPVSWLAYKQLGNPLAPLVFGMQLDKIDQLERRLMEDPKEKEVQAEYLRRAERYRVWLTDIEGSLERERSAGAGTHPAAQGRRRRLGPHRGGAPGVRGVAARRAGGARAVDRKRARKAWTGPGRSPGCRRTRVLSPATRTARRRSRRPSRPRGATSWPSSSA